VPALLDAARGADLLVIGSRGVTRPRALGSERAGRPRRALLAARRPRSV